MNSYSGPLDKIEFARSISRDEYEIKLHTQRPPKTEDEIIALLRNIAGENAAITKGFKKRLIYETVNGDVEKEMNGRLTVTQEERRPGTTALRFKNIVTPEKGGLLSRVEKTAIAQRSITVPLANAFRNGVRAGLSRMEEMPIAMGIMLYHTYKTKSAEKNVAITWDYGEIVPRYNDVARGNPGGIRFEQLEIDSHVSREIVSMTARKATAFGFEIDLDPGTKEGDLLENPVQIEVMAADAARHAARRTRAAENGVVYTPFYEDYRLAAA